jgi:hypothetical protein
MEGKTVPKGIENCESICFQMLFYKTHLLKYVYLGHLSYTNIFVAPCGLSHTIIITMARHVFLLLFEDLYIFFTTLKTLLKQNISVSIIF